MYKKIGFYRFKKIHFPFFIAFLLLFQNCRTAKLATTIPITIHQSNQSIFSHIDSSMLNFNYLASKLSVKTNLNGKQQNFNANMKWKKNEQIWLSFSILGFEGVRISITPDSIKIIDRLNKQFYIEPFSYLNEKAGMDITFGELENILLGKTIKMDNKSAIYSVLENGNHQIKYDGATFSNQTNLDSIMQLPVDMTILDNSGRILFVAFSNYVKKEGKFFSMNRLIKANDMMNKIEIDANYEQIEVKDFLEFPFQINQNYTRVH